MKYLNDIIKVASKNKVKHIQVIGNSTHRKGKLNELYEGIVNRKFETDRQACKSLYGTNEINQKYRNLKARLEKRLLNTLFFIDLNHASFNEYQKAYYNCYKNLAAIKILLGRAARNAGIKLCEKTLSQAIKFHFTDISMILLRDLRYHYGGIVGNMKKFNEYNRLLREHLINYGYENRALEVYSTIVSNFTASKTVKPDLVIQAKEFAIEMEGALRKGNSLAFIVHAYLIIILRFQIENNHKKVIESCDHAIESVKKIKFFSNTHLFVFLFKKLDALIQLKRYEEGEVTAKECLALQSDKNFNWILTMFFYFVLLLRAQKYQEAYNLFSQTKSIKKNKAIPAIMKDLWKIIDAYIHYFISAGKVTLPSGTKAKRFSLKFFIKSVKTVTKDKRGMNISILVIQVLFLLQEKKYDEVITRTETLRSYTTKYLRNDDTFRSNCFIKMLLQIPAANFHPIASERKAKPYFDKLKSKPLELANQTTEVEIIPYEVLWELVLESLKMKKGKS